ncbi:hypothetical protein [Candidatus Leptofilum sp.]|uniref:hypothetical protein n=1 Tax=Candidatus Leptofilum sp. TaxID=3241576 RepID=UPI003B5B8D74
MSDRNRRETGTGFTGLLGSYWRRLPRNFRWNIEDTFQPEDLEERLLPNEEPQLEIRLAWYRDLVGGIVFHYFNYVLGITLLLVAGIMLYALLTGTFSLYWAFLPFVLLLVLIVYAIMERIEYRQWRLLKTNARLIISIPQPGSLFLVDNIELKGLPQVVDTNWSRNPVWRIFQFFTGARDLYLSLAAYRFVEGTARVGDALIIPDVMPDQVFALKRIIFTIPGGGPQKVTFAGPQEVKFPEPQKVIPVDEPEEPDEEA